jgi:Cu-processing system ATP-binding protein
MDEAVNPPPAVIEAVGLTKRFGRLEVLRGVDLRVEPGRITGLVGPNAAGKSTLLKAVLGLVRPDGGTLQVLGHSVNGGEGYRHGLGYMPQSPHFPDNLTGAEVLTMLRDLRGMESEPDDTLLRGFQLEGEMYKPVRVLSGGTRQKLSAAIAFLFRPSLLVLDEPTASLDPVASGTFKEHLLERRAAGTAVLLASHTLSELEEIADDIVFLLEGRVHFHGPVSQLMALTGFARLERAIAALMQRQGAR